jgi:hypothetical protein
MLDAEVSGTSSMFRRQALIGIVAAALASVLAPASDAGLLGPLFTPKPEPSLVFAYRGWRVDASRALKGQRPMVTVRKLKTQIDIVEQTGLPAPTLAFMRALPIIGTSPSAVDPGRYVPGKGVFIRAKGLDDKRPILLRQLLYAYANQRLPGGFANPTAERLRLEAASKHVWPKDATMLRSSADYFAMTASAYLYGAITSEPYTRADLKRTQPDAYQWLADLFDGGRPRV